MTLITEQNARAYDAGARDWAQVMEGSVIHHYLEKPAMRKLIPQNLEYKSILCIGVGSGEELEPLILQNPRRIVGIDISTKLLKVASQQFPSLETHQMDMMALDFPDASFDFVYSSLAFHYAPDWDELMARIWRVLRPGGQLLFSTHHPQCWGKKPATGKISTNVRGITLTEHTATLPGNITITYYNHSDERAIIESVEHAGFEVLHAAPPEITSPLRTLRKEEQEKYDSLVKKNAQTPLFFIVLAQKPNL
jgi:ubiquinone/menaquinone biosynthesis C-methylase UbiE